MKVFQKLVLVILGIFMLGTAYAATDAAPTQKKEKAIEYLFIETAQTGDMQKDTTQDNTYIITLKNVDPWVTYFSNVPERITGFMPLQDFVQLLARETQTKYQAGLNSGLIAFANAKEKTGKMSRYILSIKQPEFDPATQTLILKAHIVPGAQKDPIPKEVDFHHISLFIDSICASCAGDNF